MVRAVLDSSVLVSAGDRKHLLALETYESIRIVTPRQFLELLTSD